MDINKFNEINDTIAKLEIEQAKSLGVLENIKKQWLEEYGTDDFEKITEILENLKAKLQANEMRIDKLYDKLVESYDWDMLRSKIGE